MGFNALLVFFIIVGIVFIIYKIITKKINRWEPK
jgi:hypothetical protein